LAAIGKVVRVEVGMTYFIFWHCRGYNMHLLFLQIDKCGFWSGGSMLLFKHFTH